MYPLLQRQIIGRAGPHLVILGGVHGDEYEPVVAARSLANGLDASKLHGRVTIVPCVNQPAFATNTRCGPDGLDLARTCPGNSDGSITQQIAHAVSSLIRSADFLIDMHTGGRVLKMAPLSGYVLHRDEKIRAQQHEMSAAFGLPVIWATSASLDGRTLSVARDANVPAIYVEFGGGGDFHEEITRSYVEGCLSVMAALGMLERPSPRHTAEHTIIDSRTGSGVLQVQHPSPDSGIFLPSVRLGTAVCRGQLIGRLIDLVGEREISVCAAEDGVVVGLRALPSVSRGEALAAIAGTGASHG